MQRLASGGVKKYEGITGPTSMYIHMNAYMIPQPLSELKKKISSMYVYIYIDIHEYMRAGRLARHPSPKDTFGFPRVHEVTSAS